MEEFSLEIKEAEEEMSRRRAQLESKQKGKKHGKR